MKAPFKGCIFKEYPAGSITQLFGENPALYANLGLKAHNGIDLIAPHGTPMVAVERGTVVDVRLDETGYGRHLRIIGHTNLGICNEWTYGHCHTIAVKVGDTVQEGDVIATMGNTGFVTGAGHASWFWGDTPKGTDGTHLHLGLRKVRRTPAGWSYPGSKVKIEVLNYGNGYKGAIDPLPYFSDVKPDIEKLEKQVSLLQQVVELYKKLKQIK